MQMACDALLSGNFKIEKRMMMDVVIKRSTETFHYYALNDVVISKSESSMVLIQVHSDNEKINEYRADGLIIATPTGSTGYSLSAGGPVADPTMELFIASPICAHELHARPALMPSDKSLHISLSDELGHKALVTLDGKEKEKISVGDEVIVTKSEHYTDIIKIKNQSFYDVLTQKLK
jgi:NAD+ kinase